MKIDWKKAVGFGALGWVLMFVIVSALIALGVYGLSMMPIVTALIAGVISFILAGYIKPKNNNIALTYGATWVVVGVILDMIVTTKFNAQIFSSWSLWLGYALVVLAPVLKVKK